MPYEDDAGPTPQRLARAGALNPDKSKHFYTEAGRARSSKRITMLDDALGRAWMRRKITAAEYSALRKYALHWLAGGLSGHLGSFDLNRILAFDPGQMSGLAKTEAQADHRRLYHQAREAIGFRPALVADNVACYDLPLVNVGLLLGFKSPHRGRTRAAEILSDAGYRLGKFWDEINRSH